MGRFHIFPWREEEASPGGLRVLRPTVDVLLTYDSFGIATKALIDTGSPRTILPRGVGDALGIDFPRSTDPNLRHHYLMGRRWPAITVLVLLELPPFSELSWEAEVDFVLEEDLPFGLLGFEGFLNRWAVSFNGYHSYFVVEPVEAFEERIPPDPFEEFQRRWPDSYQ